MIPNFEPGIILPRLVGLGAGVGLFALQCKTWLRGWIMPPVCNASLPLYDTN